MASQFGGPPCRPSRCFLQCRSPQCSCPLSFAMSAAHCTTTGGRRDGLPAPQGTAGPCTSAWQPLPAYASQCTVVSHQRHTSPLRSVPPQLSSAEDRVAGTWTIEVIPARLSGTQVNGGLCRGDAVMLFHRPPSVRSNTSGRRRAFALRAHVLTRATCSAGLN